MNIQHIRRTPLRLVALAALVVLLMSPVQAALVNKYNFNGGSVADSVGGANGTLVGTASVALAGRLNLTGGGDGNSYAELPATIATSAVSGGTAGAFSFETWARATNNVGWASLASFGGDVGGDPNGGDNDYIQLIPLTGDGAATLRATSKINGGGESFVDGVSPLSTTTDQHIVVVVDQSGGLPGTVEMYVDGVSAGSAPVQAGLDITTMASGQNWLGRSQWQDASFDGSYDEFRVYDHALTAGEVTTSFIEGPDLPTTLLTLVVNTETGLTSIRNDASVPLTFAGYEISSAAGALDATDWLSLEEQGIDAVGSGNPDLGETWSEVGGADDTFLSELFLQGESTIAAGNSLNLGLAFDPTVFGLGVDGDLRFSFGPPDEALIATRVEYINGTGTNGDFDTDGDVDGADFLRWQRDFPTLNAADLAQWQNNYGAGNLVAGSVAVPEPGSVALLVIGGVLFLDCKRKAVCMPHYRVGGLVFFLASLSVVATATAGTTTDRLYRFGEGDVGSFSIGDIVGSGLVVAQGPATFDSAGTSGTGNIQPLFAQGASPGGNDPRYVSPGNPAVPTSTFAAQFDGNDYLFGRRLGQPSSSDPAVDIPANGDDTDGLAPEDYSLIFDRGFQFWINPAATGALQSVVMDTNQHGVQITSGGNWSMRYAGSDYDSGVSVQTGQWSHVMLVRPAGPVNAARLYVNGVAVSAAVAEYDPADNARLVVGANTTDDEGTLGMSEFFNGVIDELDMFIMGTNGAEPPTDYGTFDIATDNDFIANAVAGKQQGDINLDGFVNSTDVSIFVSNWLATPKVIDNLVLAGIETYQMGDLDFDGTIDIEDAFLLHEGIQQFGSGISGLDFSLLNGAPVPEATSLSFVVVGMLVSFARRHGRQSV